MTSKSEIREEHEREAVRLRALAAAVTTGVMQARLLNEAEKHLRLARGEERGQDELAAATAH